MLPAPRVPRSRARPTAPRFTARNKCPCAPPRMRAAASSAGAGMAAGRPCGTAETDCGARRRRGPVKSAGNAVRTFPGRAGRPPIGGRHRHISRRATKPPAPTRTGVCASAGRPDAGIGCSALPVGRLPAPDSHQPVGAAEQFLVRGFVCVPPGTVERPRVPFPSRAATTRGVVLRGSARHHLALPAAPAGHHHPGPGISRVHARKRRQPRPDTRPTRG